MAACLRQDNSTAAVAEVYRLRDACTTLHLIRLAPQHDIVDYVEETAADLVASSSTMPLVTSSSSSLSSSTATSLPPSCVFIGVSSREHCDIYLVLPTYAHLFFDFTMHWAFVANGEMARQYAGRCTVAMLQTVGGGWASLHRADRALLCALQLYRVAEAVFDEEVVRKCRLFIGWAHLWNSHPTKALNIFQRELNDAIARGDLVHERRCLHAICNTTRNPHLAPGGAYTSHFDLVDCWSGAFV